MDGLIAPPMPTIPTTAKHMRDDIGGVPAGPTNPTHFNVDENEARKSSLDEEDQAMLGITGGEKRRFSYGAQNPKAAAEEKTITKVIVRPHVKLSAKQQVDIALAFEAFDVAGTGYMSTVNLRVALRALGFDARKQEMKKILYMFDKGNTGRLCYSDFMTIIEMKLGEDDSKEDIMKAFKLFDKDNTGRISFANLRQVATELGEEVNDEEIAEMLAEADLDDNGTLDQEEFFKIMKKTTLY